MGCFSACGTSGITDLMLACGRLDRRSLSDQLATIPHSSATGGRRSTDSVPLESLLWPCLTMTVVQPHTGLIGACLVSDYSTGMHKLPRILCQAVNLLRVSHIRRLCPGSGVRFH